MARRVICYRAGGFWGQHQQQQQPRQQCWWGVAAGAAWLSVWQQTNSASRWHAPLVWQWHSPGSLSHTLLRSTPLSWLQFTTSTRYTRTNSTFYNSRNKNTVSLLRLRCKQSDHFGGREVGLGAGGNSDTLPHILDSWWQWCHFFQHCGQMVVDSWWHLWQQLVAVVVLLLLHWTAGGISDTSSYTVDIW